VLFDAVAIIASEEGAMLLARDAAAKDFATDAYAHCKFIGYSSEAMALFEKAGLADDLDEGCIRLDGARDAGAFLKTCGALRFWDREANVDLDARV
jgi:catalase